MNSAAVASKAEQGNPIDRTDNVEAKTIDTAQKRNPFRKAAKGMEISRTYNTIPREREPPIRQGRGSSLPRLGVKITD